MGGEWYIHKTRKQFFSLHYAAPQSWQEMSHLHIEDFREGDHPVQKAWQEVDVAQLRAIAKLAKSWCKQRF